jgi:hypothetical protein
MDEEEGLLLAAAVAVIAGGLLARRRRRRHRQGLRRLELLAGSRLQAYRAPYEYKHFDWDLETWGRHRPTAVLHNFR